MESQLIRGGERESDVSERRCSEKAGASREGDNNEPRPKPRPHPPRKRERKRAKWLKEDAQNEQRARQTTHPR